MTMAVCWADTLDVIGHRARKKPQGYSVRRKATAEMCSKGTWVTHYSVDLKSWIPSSPSWQDRADILLTQWWDEVLFHALEKKKLAGLCRAWKISTALVKVWRGCEPLKRGAYSRRLKGLVARDAFDVTVEHPLHWRFKKRTPKFSVVGTLPWTSENSLRSVLGKCVGLSWQGPGEKPRPRESLACLLEKRLSLTFSLQKSNPHLPDTLTQLILQYNSMQRNNIIMGKPSSAPCGFSWPWIVGPREYFACSEDAIGTRKDPSNGCTLQLCCCILKTTARPQMLEVCHPCKALTCTTVHIPII